MHRTLFQRKKEIQRLYIFQKDLKMPRHKKQQTQEVIEEEKKQPKKSKSKKHKKEFERKSNHNAEKQVESGKTPDKHLENNGAKNREPIEKLISELEVSKSLLPNSEYCKYIEKKLIELTLSVRQNCIVRESYVLEIIESARKCQKLSINDYFYMDYTNRLEYINKLLSENSPRKYEKIMKKISEEIDRVIKMVVYCLNQATIRGRDNVQDLEHKKL